uniref:FA complementation group E n=1 Tax=Coturnix japonica TaxID=93934 RepID=A0A8C2U5N9_COTJA
MATRTSPCAVTAPGGLCPPWLQLLAGPCRLLLHALCSGPAGSLAALRALQRLQAQHGAGHAFPWSSFADSLCAEEPTLDGPDGALVVKPRLLLLPVLCQRNLFSLLNAVLELVPANCIQQLLRAAGQDPQPDPWVHALRVLLLQGMERSFPPPPALTASCQQQLKRLCQKITQSKAEGRSKLRWCFSKRDGDDGAGCVLPGGKRKKVLEESLELNEEREGKRPLLEDAVIELQGGEDGTAGMGGEEEEKSSILWLGLFGALLKDGVSLQHTELSVPPELHILNSCSPSQVSRDISLQLEVLLLSLTALTFLLWLLALTPDLSYSSAAVLAEQLFLTRVLSLSQPPSRHLMAALTSFCSKYSEPFCQVLVAPVLQEPGQGVCCIVCSSISAMLKAAVLLSLLQEPLPSELFDLLVLTLCRQAPAFATSLSYAKLLTAVLTTYHSQVSALSPSHRSRLAAALDGSNAALRGSLQAVLGRCVLMLRGLPLPWDVSHFFPPFLLQMSSLEASKAGGEAGRLCVLGQHNRDPMCGHRSECGLCVSCAVQCWML